MKYDKTNSESILSYARALLGKCVHDLYPDAEYAKTGNKGEFGQRIEEVHFGISNNSNREPDFKDAGVELKCTALKRLVDGSMVSKERLSLNIINYLEEYDKTYEQSSFMHKNALLLLMFYLNFKGKNRFDLLFKIIRLWSIPEEDAKIFMDDWAIIHAKIVRGLAHELSESDTLYLATSPKGAGKGKNMRPQRGTPIKAKQRAYAIKASYVNQIIVDSMLHPEMVSGVEMSAKQLKKIRDKQRMFGSIVRSVSDYEDGETFEELVGRRFAKYIGKTVVEIERELGVAISNSPKAISYSVCRAILGVKEQKIAEFEKAGVLLKTVRLEENGTLKESMSFQNVKYKEIVGESRWKKSDWYDTIARHRLFFVVFRKKKGGKAKDATLGAGFFWGMPIGDVEKASAVWEDTRDKVRKGDYGHFMAMKGGNPVCHIRPKGRDSHDTMETPQGGRAKKYCYWLNRPYVLGVVNAHLRQGKQGPILCSGHKM